MIILIFGNERCYCMKINRRRLKQAVWIAGETIDFVTKILHLNGKRDFDWYLVDRMQKHWIVVVFYAIVITQKYIYFDEFTHYANHMWSIQGTLYLYFRFFVSPIIVFFITTSITIYYSTIVNLTRLSPTFFFYFYLLLLQLMLNTKLFHQTEMKFGE